MQKLKLLAPLIAGFFVALSPAYAQRALPRAALEGYAELPNFTTQATNTISSGALTPTAASILIAAETGTSDNLTTVTKTAWQTGDVIRATADSGDTIIIKDGDGNITTVTGGDITITGADTVYFQVTSGGVNAWKATGNFMGGKNVYDVVEWGVTCNDSSGTVPNANLAILDDIVDAIGTEGQPGIIHIGCKFYISGEWTIDEDGVTVMGEGAGVSAIYVENDTSDGIALEGASVGADTADNITLLNFALAKTPSSCPFTSTCTGITGQGLILRDAQKALVDGVVIQRFPNGNLVIEGGQLNRLSNFHLIGGTPNSGGAITGAGSLVQEYNASLVYTIPFTLNYSNFEIGGSGFDYNIAVTSADGANFSNFYAATSDIAQIFLQPTTGEDIGPISFTNFYLDAGSTPTTTIGITIPDNSEPVRAFFSNGFIFNPGQGIVATAADTLNLTIVGLQIQGTTNECIDITGATGNDGGAVTISDTRCIGPTGNVPGKGIEVTNLNSLTLSNNQFSNITNTAIALTSGTITNAVITGNVLNNNGTDYSNAATVTNLILCDNIGIDNLDCGVSTIVTSSGDLTFLPDGSNQALRITDDEQVIVGAQTSAIASIGGFQPNLQMQGNGGNDSAMAFVRAQDNGNAPQMFFAKSRGSIGSETIVASNDNVGLIQFQAYDGTDFNNSAAVIRAKMDGTAASNDTPGKLEFATGDNATTTTVLTLNADTTADFVDDVTLGGDLIITNSSSPAAADACTAGTIVWDASYIYVCTASGAWKRSALTGGY